jgi:hypothetical protein
VKTSFRIGVLSGWVTLKLSFNPGIPRPLKRSKFPEAKHARRIPLMWFPS